MIPSQEREQGSIKLLELEAQTHEAMTPMIEAHIDTSGGKVCDIGYDRDLHPYQQLEVAYTPPADELFGIPISLIPSEIVMSGMKVALAWQLRSIRKANKMIKAFQETQAFEGSNYSIAEDIERRLLKREAVAVINDHLNRGDLRDAALLVGGVELAIGEKWVREHTVVFLGKNISREGYGRRGRPKAEKITQAMGIIWVQQNTVNAKNLNIPSRAKEIMKNGAKAAVDELRKDGLLAAVVPAASTTLLKSDVYGDYYYRPPTRSSVSTLAGFNAILGVAIKDGEILPSRIHAAEDSAEMSTRERHTRRLEMVDAALVSLALKNAQITGLPMIFQRVNKQWNSAEPDGSLMQEPSKFDGEL